MKRASRRRRSAEEQLSLDFGQNDITITASEGSGLTQKRVAAMSTDELLAALRAGSFLFSHTELDLIHTELEKREEQACA